MGAVTLDSHAAAIGIVALVTVRYLLAFLVAAFGWGETADSDAVGEAVTTANDTDQETCI
jgi:hypothetical protein